MRRGSVTQQRFFKHWAEAGSVLQLTWTIYRNNRINIDVNCIAGHAKKLTFGMIDEFDSCPAITGRGQEFLLDCNGNRIPGLWIAVDTVI